MPLMCQTPLLLAMLLAPTAPADELQPFELPDPSASPYLRTEPAGAPQDVPEPLRYRRELGIIPLVGGDSDIGVAVGTVGSLAVFAPHARPYLWRLELNGLASFKKAHGSWVNPFQDYYLKLSLPSLARSKLRLAIRLAYTRYATLHYWGVGNASVVPAGSSPIYNQYKLTYPHATVEIQHRFAKPFYWQLGLEYFFEMPHIYANSQLDQDLSFRPDLVRGRQPFHLAMVSPGIGYDTRDNETAPARGQSHVLSLRYAPGYGRALPHSFVGLNASLRAYVPLVGPRLVVAFRLVGDGYFGDVPVFLLAESPDGYALGGVSGVRGVPAQRYYGKVKTYGTAEARLKFPSFRAGEQKLAFGLVAFADAGRVWADWRRDVAADGSGVGLKYGVGGGIRLQWGATFLLRGDVAWSPDAAPLGFYFNVGHIF